MGDLALKVEGLTKEYRLGTIGYGTMREDLQTWWARFRGKDDPNSLVTENHNSGSDIKHFLALDEINFEVKKGERIGIIGRNGAGKSTLLKILSQITSPTRGNIYINGRIGSLLEVGTGFHQELTGRENIYLNGSILGMSKREISMKLDEIVDFAGISQFLDTPVKRYSSGMFVRLGFAVAAHLEPEILIVDEVLAVGDAEFQNKAIGKMEEVSQNDGRTILFVSHNTASIRKLCNQGLYLNNGRVESVGKVGDILNEYLGSNNKLGDNRSDNKWVYAGEPDCDNDFFKLQEALIVDCKGSEIKDSIKMYESFELKFRFFLKQMDSALQFTFYLYNEDLDVMILTSSSTDLEMRDWPQYKLGENEINVEFPGYLLNKGKYRLEVQSTIVGIRYLIHPNERSVVLRFEVTEVESQSVYPHIHNGTSASILKWKSV